jgi:hypothetical protein
MRICGKRNLTLPAGYDSIAQILQGPWLETDYLKQCFLPYGHAGPCQWGDQAAQREDGR